MAERFGLNPSVCRFESCSGQNGITKYGSVGNWQTTPARAPPRVAVVAGMLWCLNFLWAADKRPPDGKGDASKELEKLEEDWATAGGIKGAKFEHRTATIKEIRMRTDDKR